MKIAFERKSLRARVFVLTLTGMIALLMFLGISSFASLQQSMNQMWSERLILTQALADRLESEINRNLVYLQNATFAPKWNMADKDWSAERDAIHSARLYSNFSVVFLLDQNGKLLCIDPPTASLSKAFPAEILALASRDKPFVSNAFGSENARAVVCIIPLRNGGSIGGEIPAESDLFKSIIRSLKIGATGRAEIVDNNGSAIAAEGRESKSNRAISSVSLKSLPWKVRIVQDRQEWTAPLTDMKKKVFGFGLLFLFISVPLVWGVTDSVISPVRSLIDAARKIANGSLDNPVPVYGQEEIGVLGKTLDQMRIKIRDLLNHVASSNRDLEKRVEERTREITNLYEKLKGKEEARTLLLHKIISAQEEERKRIARDLHDDLSQVLATLLLKLNDLEDTKKVERIRELTIQSIDSIHRLILDLRPAVLDDLGLCVAIRWYVEQHLSPFGITSYFEAKADDLRLNNQMEITLFRVAQEAINNIVRHAKAQNVMISLERRENSLLLSIEDDGHGFDVSQQGIGLQGMKERVQLLGGEFTIQSSPTSGTRIALSVPIEQMRLAHV